MRGQLIRGLLIGLFLAGCGAGSGQAQVDSRPTTLPDTATTVLPQNSDGGCDEDAMGADYCIKNPGTTVGGGTPVARQNPVPYQTCKQ